MPEKILYEYAIIRYVPQVEREEFLNVGVILYSKKLNTIKLLYQINEKRLLAFSKLSDLAMLTDHLQAFKKVAHGDKTCGLIANLDAASRFRWLTAVRSSVIQTSRPHPGFSTDLDTTAEKIFSEMVV